MLSLDSRMRQYEQIETERRVMSMLPVYIRLDGRCFSQFTKDMEKPFDYKMNNVMINVTKNLVGETNALIGYTQSDEINLILEGSSDNEHSDFGNKIHKLTSVIAGMTSSLFLLNYIVYFDVYPYSIETLPTFDCRVINLPTETEAANMILWRNLDATKNAITSAASILFTAKELLNKSGPEKQEMMFQEGINFNDYPEHFKRGTFVKKIKVKEEIDQETWDKIPEFNKPKSREVVRGKVISFSMPPFCQVDNREDVIFGNSDPIVNGEIYTDIGE